MIRIIFENGELLDCDGVNKIYIDDDDFDKISKMDPIINVGPPGTCKTCSNGGLDGLPNDSFECMCCKGEETDE